MKTLAIAIFLIAGMLPDTFANVDDSDIINPNWVKPGFRSHLPELPKEECICPLVPDCEPTAENPPQPPSPPPTSECVSVDPEQENNRLAMIFYRKFVTKIFDERLLHRDSESSFKLRNIQFKVTDQQLKKLQEAKNAREIDAVVSGIVEQSEGSTYRAMTETLCWNFVAFYTRTMQSTIFLYVILPSLVILSLVAIARFLRIRLWVLIPLLALLITYVLTYRDCNNRLELESLTSLRRNDGSNPCARRRSNNWIQRFFEKNYEADCIEHLREQAGLKRSFCDPSEVFIEMVAKLQLQYFETFVSRMISVFRTNTASLGVFESILVGCFILLLIYILMTYGIKYGFNGLANFGATYFTAPRPRQHPMLDQNQPSPPTAQGGTPAAAPPLNININIHRPKRSNSKIENNNRVEEIQDKPVLPALEQSTKEIMSQQRVESGSGDAPTMDSETDEHGSSSDEETTVALQCSLPQVASVAPQPTTIGGDDGDSVSVSRSSTKDNCSQAAEK